MKIEEILKGKKQLISFEFFPPKTKKGEDELFENVKRLKELNPDFVSVTYGAGGSTREKTNEMAVELSSKEGIEVMIHLTAVMHKKQEIEKMLELYASEGIENILALRGDAPNGVEVDFSKEEMPHAIDLINLINEKFPGKFSIGGAAFPEGHLESADRVSEMNYFKKKADAGMKFGITQLFFNNRFYFEFVDRCSKNGIEIPIIPGLMPITGYGQIERFTAMCGTEIPKKLIEKIEKFKDNKEDIEKVGIEYATNQCIELLESGTRGIHFYTLNKSTATMEIYKNIKNYIQK